MTSDFKTCANRDLNIVRSVLVSTQAQGDNPIAKGRVVHVSQSPIEIYMVLRDATSKPRTYYTIFGYAGQEEISESLVECAIGDHWLDTNPNFPPTPRYKLDSISDIRILNPHLIIQNSDAWIEVRSRITSGVQLGRTTQVKGMREFVRNYKSPKSEVEEGSADYWDVIGDWAYALVGTSGSLENPRFEGTIIRTGGSLQELERRMNDDSWWYSSGYYSLFRLRSARLASEVIATGREGWAHKQLAELP